jgi:hypothetical protein
MNRLARSAAQQHTQTESCDPTPPRHTTLPQNCLLRIGLPHHLATFSRRPLASRLFDALFRLCVALLAATAVTFTFPSTKAAESSLQIVAAGVESSEDAPFVSSDFHFLRGEYLYFQFQISGYATKTVEGSEARKISLAYEISPQDAKGVALTPPVMGLITEELSAEDKNWTPKRRASFLLPSFVAAGEFHVHLAIKDVIGNTSIEGDFPFHTGGIVVLPSTALGVQDFQFLRREDDSDPLEVPAYRPGDTVYVRFNMTGFHLGDGNEYHVSYGLTVNRPNGKPYLNEPSAAELSDRSFYPVRFVPGEVSVNTSSDVALGQYVLLLTVRDLAASRTYQVKRAFTIE